MKVCGSCKEEKPLLEFNKKSNGYQSYCSECNKKQKRAWYQENRTEERKRLKARRIKYKELGRQFIIEYLSKNSCVDCKESNIIVLEFDHLRDKDSDISELLSAGATVKKLKKEIEKCEVVCANCHKIRTATRLNSYRYIHTLGLIV